MAGKKYRKFRKVDSSGLASGNVNLNFGVIGLKVLEGVRITEKQAESARKVISRYIKPHGGMLFINLAHLLPVTKKPLEVRMGGGKGSVDHYVYNCKAGFIMFEISNVSLEIAREALEKASKKIPSDTKVIVRRSCLI